MLAMLLHLFLALLSIDVGLSQELECPGLCTCDTLEGEVDCTNLGLTAPPSFPLGEPNLRRLLLDGNQIAGNLQLAPLLSQLPALEELSIRENQLQGVSFEGVSTSASTVKILRLDNNLIDDLSRLKSLRLGLSSLVHLSLSKNELLVANLAYLSMEGIEVEGGISLERLDLSGNDLTGLTAAVGSSFTALEVFDLSHNQLSILAPNLTTLAPNIRELYVNDNQLREISPQAISTLNNLELVDLRENPDISCSSLQHLPTTDDMTSPSLTVHYDWCVEDDGTLAYPPGVTPPPTTTPEPENCFSNPDYYVRGSDRYVAGLLLHMAASVPAEPDCRVLCNEFSWNPEPCGGYSYSHYTRHCYLWAAGAKLSYTAQYTTSAIRGIFSRHWLSGLRSGTVLATYEGTGGSWEECEKLCLADNSCTGYAWMTTNTCKTYTGRLQISTSFSYWNTAIKYGET